MFYFLLIPVALTIGIAVGVIRSKLWNKNYERLWNLIVEYRSVKYSKNFPGWERTDPDKGRVVDSLHQAHELISLAKIAAQHKIHTPDLLSWLTCGRVYVDNLTKEYETFASKQRELDELAQDVVETSLAYQRARVISRYGVDSPEFELSLNTKDSHEIKGLLEGTIL